MLKYAASLGILILAIHYIATFNGLYVKTGWLDIPMHMLAGLWVGLVLAYIFGERSHTFDFKNNFLVSFLFILGTTLIVGVFWEFWEFFISQILPNYSALFEKGFMSLGDTLKDILDDMVGGSAAGIIAYFYSKKNP